MTSTYVGGSRIRCSGCLPKSCEHTALLDGCSLIEVGSPTNSSTTVFHPRFCRLLDSFWSPADYGEKGLILLPAVRRALVRDRRDTLAALSLLLGNNQLISVHTAFTRVSEYSSAEVRARLCTLGFM